MSSVTVWRDSLGTVEVTWHKDIAPSVDYDFHDLPNGTRTAMHRHFPDLDAAKAWALAKVEKAHGRIALDASAGLDVGGACELGIGDLVVERRGDGYLLIHRACVADGRTHARQEIAVVSDPSLVSRIVGFVSRVAEAGKMEVAGMAEKGELPAETSSFGQLHDHFDANFLVADEIFRTAARIGIGTNVDDPIEAKCGAANAAARVVDEWLGERPLEAFARPGSAPSP